MHQAMVLLGLRSAPDSIPLLDGVDTDFVGRFDAFFDNPIPFRYQDLHNAYPDSRYIVTHRELDDWLTSMEWLFGEGIARLDPAMRTMAHRVHRQFYGIDRFDADRLTSIHRRHYAQVADWLDDKPYVWLEVSDGFAWEPI